MRQAVTFLRGWRLMGRTLSINGRLSFNPNQLPARECPLGDFVVPWRLDPGGVLGVYHADQPRQALMHEFAPN